MDNNYVGHQNNYTHRVSTNTRTNITMMMRWKLFATINNKNLCQSSPECPLCDGVKGMFITNNERRVQSKMSLNCQTRGF